MGAGELVGNSRRNEHSSSAATQVRDVAFSPALQVNLEGAEQHP
jgi:hypothetical protein